VNICQFLSDPMSFYVIKQHSIFKTFRKSFREVEGRTQAKSASQCADKSEDQLRKTLPLSL